MEIHHIPGKKNLVPDALSRLPAEGNEEIPNAIDPEANDNELNDIWSSEVYYTTTKLHMDQALKEKFIPGYNKDKHFHKVITILSQNEEREALQSSKRNKLIRLKRGAEQQGSGRAYALSFKLVDPVTRPAWDRVVPAMDRARTMTAPEYSSCQAYSWQSNLRMTTLYIMIVEILY